ncbi:hypothetical protein WN51_02135 [Melipona quadrifasciata]|uniref:Uncharacterized protein n=1 Tax=Melipona quadrifasciata TaxID=166423 RepID=A0A0N0BDN9_9HYME|nr:hypothetical protein WN51_02135 [Melipona quadrifasciata]
MPWHLLSKGPLSCPERRSQHLERFFKGKIDKQRASWLAPKSHVDTFAPIKDQPPNTRHIHSIINHQFSQFESRRGDTSYPSPILTHGDTMIHSVAILNTISRKFETSSPEKHQ